MVRSLKVIGAVLSLVAGASGLAAPRIAPRTNSLSAGWGASSAAVDELRRVPCGDLSAAREPLTMMPATIERTPVNTGGAGPAILDRPQVEKRQSKSPEKAKERVGNEAWEVRIYNDGMNTREFVARCLVQIVGLTEMTAYQTMMQAHQNGIAVVGRYMYERAEMYHEALKKNGIICDLVPVDEEG